MAYKIKGSLTVEGDLTVQNKKVGTSVNLSSETEFFNSDSNGHVELPVLTKTEIDSALSQIPVSQYGAINNLPIGVSGSYDGGSTVALYSAMPSIIESDGTFVFLRPGTNGSSINYYYTYINNPDISTLPYTTIRTYYTGTSENIVFYDSYTKDTLIYQEIDNAKIHVVLTNGTLDKTYHQSASFNASSISGNILSCLKANNYVYIITLYNTYYDYNNPISAQVNGSDPFQFIFYRIPVSEIMSGTISTIQQVSGISGTTMYGETSPTNYVRMSTVWISDTGSSTNSFIKQPTGTNTAPFTYSVISSGKSIFDGTNIIFSFYANCFCLNTLQRLDTTYALTVTFNVSTNTYSTNLTPTPIVFSGTSTTPLSYTNPYKITTANLDGYGTLDSDGTRSTWYITDNGIQYAIRERYVLADDYLVTRCKIENFSTKSNAYIINGRTLTLQDYSSVYSEFASRVGDKLAGGSPISPTKIMFTGTGTSQGRTYTRFTRGVSDIGSTNNYTYKSINYGTINGYSPQSGRYPLPDASELLMSSKLSFCNSSNVIESYGTVLLENLQSTAGYKLDPDTLLYNTTISINPITLTNIKNTILSTVGFSSVNSRIGIYYSPRTDMCKSIACVSAYDSNGNGLVLAATVDCTLSGSVISSVVLNTIFVNQTVTDIKFTGFANFDGGEIKAHSGLSCVQYSDFTYISFSHLVSHDVPGSSKMYTICGSVSGNTVTNVTMQESFYIVGINGAEPFKEFSYIPNLGFGYYIFSPNDFGTKLIFKNCGNTLDQLPNIGTGTGTNVVILAQDVTVGFYLYFTERVPVFMNGKYYELPITTIDLNDIKSNPGNTTYFVYVRVVNDAISYVVSETEAAETDTNMYIGTFQTDGTKVSSININKVSRIGIYRPSETQIGSAFPVSTGLPTENGSINW